MSANTAMPARMPLCQQILLCQRECRYVSKYCYASENAAMSANTAMPARMPLCQQILLCQRECRYVSKYCYASGNAAMSANTAIPVFLTSYETDTHIEIWL